mmetsp:Transcript_32214/g.62906  ORF Transcript_32214/g.62906 Transcript_32214/m.62906 type:complete len:308 (-) Transcript_32214:240-1163(-)
MLRDVHSKQLAADLCGARLGIFGDALCTRGIGHVNDGAVVLGLLLYAVYASLLGTRGVAEESVLVEEPACALDVLDACVRRYVAHVDLCRELCGLVNVRVTCQLSLGDPPIELHGAPHVVHARVHVLHGAVLRVPVPLRAVVGLPVRVDQRHGPHPPSILGVLSVVRGAVEVLLDVVRLLDVHGGDGGGAGLVHLAPLKLADLLNVCLVMPSDVVRRPNAVWRHLPDDGLAAAELGVLDDGVVGALDGAGDALAGELVDELVGGGLPHPLAVLDVRVEHFGIACVGMPHPPVHVAPHQVRGLLVEGG